VVVIDKGRLTYDGKLDELVRRVRPQKRLVLRTIDGHTETHDVQPSELQPTIERLLRERPLADLTVEDPPLEDVMRELFSHPAKPLPSPSPSTTAEQPGT
jgi:ABC-2 type transport system ATP-binding protein